MQHLIKDDQRVDDDLWQTYDASDSQGLPGHALLPVSFWEKSGEELIDSALAFGVVIRENEDIDAILPYLKHIQVVTFEFAKFVDGRAFTYARQLRLNHGYKGEIRASGAFLPDQLNYMLRCGFNAFAMRSDAERETALKIKDAFSEQYQADTLVAEPLYRRR